MVIVVMVSGRRRRVVFDFVILSGCDGFLGRLGGEGWYGRRIGGTLVKSSVLSRDWLSEARVEAGIGPLTWWFECSKAQRKCSIAADSKSMVPSSVLVGHDI